ncbi:hypothetical protein [Desulfovibrio sp. UCD-KL4C]|uniref:hypothetical protein n=1 Tax=Desulfovibrio sp. UCD-KL4C TaxID=2578120 RepID=UPI0025BD2407|nr:hypothetical protein [Desulfovibrio sp. UCD-KL4C]
MNAENVQAAQFIQNSYPSKSISTKSTSDTNGFESAMDISRDEQETKKVDKNVSSSNSNGEDSLESLALPKWYSEFIPEKTLLSLEINTAYWKLAGELTKDDVLSNEDRAILDNFTENDPMSRREHEQWAFQEKYKREILEYDNMVHSCFQKALSDHGINSHKDYYENVLLNEENSEAIHQDMKKSLESNPRYFELRKILD